MGLGREKCGRTSSTLGAGTRMSRQRERMGAMSLLVLLAQRMRRMLDMYFSIVRRRAACASRVKESASCITTTMVCSERKSEDAVSMIKQTRTDA